jgi:hypothetical protein
MVSREMQYKDTLGAIREANEFIYLDTRLRQRQDTACHRQSRLCYALHHAIGVVGASQYYQGIMERNLILTGVVSATPWPIALLPHMYNSGYLLELL